MGSPVSLAYSIASTTSETERHRTTIWGYTSPNLALTGRRTASYPEVPGLNSSPSSAARTRARSTMLLRLGRMCALALERIVQLSQSWRRHSTGRQERLVGGGVVVSAAAPIDAATQEFAGAAPRQAKALAAEMSLVGVPHVDRQPGHPVRADAATGRCAGLSQRKESLETQRPLECLRADPNRVEAAAPQLAGRDGQVRRRGRRSQPGATASTAGLLPGPADQRVLRRGRPAGDGPGGARAPPLVPTPLAIASPSRSTEGPHTSSRLARSSTRSSRTVGNGGAIPGRNRTPTSVVYGAMTSTFGPVRGPINCGLPPIGKWISTPPVGRCR